MKIFQNAEKRLLNSEVVNKKRRKQNILNGIILAVLVIGIGSCMFGGDDKNSSKNNNQTTQKVEQSKENKHATVVDEKFAYQKFNSEIQRGIAAVDNDWENLWQATITNFTNGLIDGQTTFAQLRQLEQNLINDEMIFYNAPIDTNISQETQNKMKQIKKGYQEWAIQRRKSCENFRQALGMGQITQAKIQETIDMIGKADAVMLAATTIAVELENKLK